MIRHITFLFLLISLGTVSLHADRGKYKQRGYHSVDVSKRHVPTAEQLNVTRLRRTFNSAIEKDIERKSRAAQEHLKRETARRIKAGDPRRHPDDDERQLIQLKRTLRKAGKWRHFLEEGSSPAAMRASDGRLNRGAPTVNVNGSTSATIDAGGHIEIELTFGAGDSAWIDLIIDLDGDGVPSDGDFSAFEYPFFGPGGSSTDQWVFDNSREDEDSSEGTFKISIDGFPYMDVTAFFQATVGSESAHATLTVNALTGAATASGTVSGVSEPALIFFTGDESGDLWITFTNSNGAFSFGFDEGEYSYFIGASGTDPSGFFLAQHTVEETAELSDLTIDLATDATISGKIVDAESQIGVESVDVQVFTDNYYIFSLGTGRTGTDGSFSIPLAGGTAYSPLSAFHPDYYSEGCGEAPIYMAAGASEMRDCEVEAWPAFVSGAVTDASSGAPLEDIEVDLSVSDDTGDMWAYNVAWTDHDGQYRLGSTLGSGTIWASDPQWREYQDEADYDFVVEEAEVKQDFALEPYDGGIEGKITDSSTGAALEGADVYAFDTDWDFTTWGTSDENGDYFLPAINGTFTVCASNWWLGYEEVCVENVTVASDTATQNFALEPLPPPDGYIQGYVKTADSGTPIEGVGVEAYPAESTDDYQYYYGETDETGFFSIGVDNNTYTVCTWDWTGMYETDEPCVENVTVNDDTVTLADMELKLIEWDGALAGSVFDQHGGAVVSWVSAYDTVELVGNSIMTDATGGYTLPLMDGDYIAMAFPWNWGWYLQDYETGVEIGGDTVTVNFVTPVIVLDAIVKGTVTDSTGAPLAGAYVNIEGVGEFAEDTGPYFWEETDEDGSFHSEVMGFTDRAYWIFGEYYDESGELMIGAVEDVTIGSGDTVVIELILKPREYRSTIYGYVFSGEDPVEEAYVYAYNFETYDYFDTYSDADGYYKMRVFNGEYEVCAEDWDTGDGECDYVLVNDEEAEVSFEFGPARVYMANEHGNFRFTWDNYGGLPVVDEIEVDDSFMPVEPSGEWPAESDVHYLYGGGLVVTGYSEDGDLRMGGLYGNTWTPLEMGIDRVAVGGADVITRYLYDVETELHVREVIATQDGKDYVVIGTNLRNPLDRGTLSHVHAGYFMDWDVAYSKITFDSEAEFWTDDMAGSMSTSITDAIHGLPVSLTVSYMHDDDGDSEASPGYVAMATLYEPGYATHHMSLDADDWGGFWFPDMATFMEMIQQGEDSPDETAASDYRIMQTSDSFTLAPGDEMSFVTVLLAATSTEEFQSILQDAAQSVADYLWAFTTDVVVEVPLPTEYALHQNQPNPFNPETSIQFDLPEATDVTLTVYDLLGRELTLLVDASRSAGVHRVAWDGRNSAGAAVATGVYIYHLQAGDFTSTKKLLLMR